MAFDPPKTYGSGRVTIDYDKLKELWLDSGMMPKEFLFTYGLKCTSSTVRKVEKAWRESVDTSDIAAMVPAPKPVEHDDVWNTIKQWRINQGQEDYQTAAALRQHIKIILNKALIKNDNGTIDTRLPSKETDTLSRSLLNIQKIQRLALGMSTENVGVPNTDQLQLDNEIIEATGTDDIPTFIVEVNKNGKFVRPKPRQVSAAGTAPRTAKTS